MMPSDVLPSSLRDIFNITNSGLRCGSNQCTNLLVDMKEKPTIKSDRVES